MTSQTRLFDEKGRLLPPEQCNIKPLESLTKDRAKSPSRRSPSRHGKNDTGSDPSSSTKLPHFVQEVNIKSNVTRLTSPIALRVDSTSSKDLKQDNSANNDFTNGLDKHEEIKHLSSSAKPVICGSRSATNYQRNKMEPYEEVSEGKSKIKFPEIPVFLWTTEDVCVWLDFIQLKNLKESFISQGVTGKMLLDLNYGTLDELNLSNSSEDREHFLAEVYNLQQENGQVDDDDEEVDKEIEETLRDASNHEKNNTKAPLGILAHLNTDSDRASSGSLASSSRTGSDYGHTPTTEIVDDEDRAGKGVSKSKQVSNNLSHNGAGNQMPKTRKESSKNGGKKRKPRGKRISRFWNSIHQGNNKTSTSSDATTASTIYKNAFHNMMNAGPQGVIKVWTEMFLADMQYVSLLISHEATALEVVEMVLEKSNAREDPECYRICEINEESNEYVLEKNESPLQRERQWSDPDNCRFELRWRNERLIEWRNTSGSVAEDLSLQKPNQGSPTEKNDVDPRKEESKGDELSKQSASDLDSPEYVNLYKPVLETTFDYNVQVEYRNDRKDDDEIMVVDGGPQRTTYDDHLDTITTASNGRVEVDILGNADERRSGEDPLQEPEPTMGTKKQLTSSCPDLSSAGLLVGRGEVEEIHAAKEPGDEEGMREPLINEELEYSRQLRKSSKKLSRRLKLQTETIRREGAQEVETGITGDNQGHENTGMEGVTDGEDHMGSHVESKDTDSLRGLVTDNEGTRGDTRNVPMEMLMGGHSATVGDLVDLKVHVEEQSSVKEVLSQRPGDEDIPEVTRSATPPEVNELMLRIGELENEISYLVEENRNLKKSCRTFEGKSRLKERELEELEEEKNDLVIQMQEMGADLHMMRAENTELRTNLAEANTKLSDVDGWVTRDVFEEIRGQLSVSLEDAEEKEELVLEVEKQMKVLKQENRKIKDLELKIETLNERIREDEACQEGMKRDIKDKGAKIRALETQIVELRSSIEKGEKEKESVEKKLIDAEGEIEISNKKQAVMKKDLKKRTSDQEYEILIMKEEKKELCVKMKSFENNVETLREEMKKKDDDHEAVIAEMKQQSDIKDESLSVTVSTLEQLVTARDTRIKQLKKQLTLSGKPESELQAKEHEYEQNKVYLKHLIALVREKDPSLLDVLNRTLSSRDPDDWC